jgi:hypothetical protein
MSSRARDEHRETPSGRAPSPRSLRSRGHRETRFARLPRLAILRIAHHRRSTLRRALPRYARQDTDGLASLVLRGPQPSGLLAGRARLSRALLRVAQQDTAVGWGGPWPSAVRGGAVECGSCKLENPSEKERSLPVRTERPVRTSTKRRPHCTGHVVRKRASNPNCWTYARGSSVSGVSTITIDAIGETCEKHNLRYVIQ